MYLPLFISAELRSSRPEMNDPAPAQVRVVGSKISADAVSPLPHVPAQLCQPSIATSFPFASCTIACPWRLPPRAPVAVHAGSTIAGYATPLHATRTRHDRAPGAVTARPHGASTLVSNAQPSTVSAASCAAPPPITYV